MSLLQGYSSEEEDTSREERFGQLARNTLIGAPDVNIETGSEMIPGPTTMSKTTFSGRLLGNLTTKADFEFQRRLDLKRKAQLTKNKKKRKKQKVSEDFDYADPWQSLASESVSRSESEQDVEDVEQEEDDAAEETEDHDYVLDTPKVTTEFLGSSKQDYLGRSYLHIPRDLDVNLLKEPGSQECFVPKRVIHTFKGHSKGITKLEFFPKSGHLLLSASNDGKIYLWDMYHKRELLRGYYGHSHAVKDITFNNDGSRFLSCGFDKKVILWDTETGNILETIQLRSIPNVIKFNPLKNNEFIVGLTNHKIEHYDLESTSQAPTQTYDHHLGAINSLTIIDEGNRFMSTSDDKTVRFWDWQINIPIKFISDPSQHSMPFAAIYPNQKYIALQSMDNSISVIQGYGKYKFNKKKHFLGHNVAGFGIGIDFSPDGKILMSGDSKGSAFFWDWKTCKIINKIKISDKCINCIKAHPQESSKVVMGGIRGEIYYCD
ncbi:WD40 repeat-like protein [Hyphopichia burtonii NRRL Y-1933]|uniref:Pre-mRNA-processing factor 17 n=1 Tax=Hyphopichia burtonii NRRL Y-1933 TaxID=984485 RepID=A0A1E4RG24_9ASCO|nr:WD40 repeat-like protein [Hyphopichia burtonii NRRL Y-1933]ODV66166.1 WD40 repeat-like protein [Hyphopichia burtonii NRRL Y-1933]